EKKAKEKKARLAKEKKEKERKIKEQNARVAAETERFQKELRAEEERRRLQRLAYAQAAAKRNLIDEYKAKILAKIKSKLVLPPDLPNDPIAEYGITLLPGGEILSVKLRKSSGFRSFDEAVERAIILARPLPLPKDKSLFPNFRDLGVKVHYLDD
ncbi:MAG: cell envelope integrity protein TolA, partial [Nitrosomonadaceae bacterium]|nr:cell envelope integrity protein TolA [Nitrosomonadaceae bacterium]